jgi:uncharacterized protein YgiM (DUF1202 family)
MKLRMTNTFTLFIVLALTVVLSGIADTVALADGVTITARSRTNVRSGPGTEYTIIGQLSQGDEMTVTGRDSTSNDWFRLDFNGAEGWVAASVVTLSGDPTTVGVVEPANAVSTSGNSEVTATVYGETSVRRGPGTSYSVITTVSEDSESIYDVTGILELDPPLECKNNRINDVTDSGYESSAWLRVNAGGEEGWVQYTAVDVNGPLCSVSEVSYSVSEEAVSGDGVYVQATRNVNIRATSYAQSEVLEVLPSGTIVLAEAQDPAGNRVRITYRGTTGWVSLSYVSVVQGYVSELEVAE